MPRYEREFIGSHLPSDEKPEKLGTNSSPAIISGLKAGDLSE